MYKFEGLLFYRFHEQHLFFDNAGTQLKAWQKTMPRIAERPLLLASMARQNVRKQGKSRPTPRTLAFCLRTGSRTPADSRRRQMVAARGPGLYEPMQADIPRADVDVREPGLDLYCRGHWRTPGGHLADKARKRPEVAGEALTLPGNYRISVAGAARPISSILAEMHARNREQHPKM